MIGFSSTTAAPFATYTLPSGTFASSPVVDADGRVYALSTTGKVYCLSKKLGFKWSYDLGAPASFCELAIGNDGTLYVGGTNKLVALK